MKGMGFGDSRLILVSLAGEGMLLAGEAILRLWKSHTRTGRISQHLRRLEEAGLIARQGRGRVDERVFRITELGRRATLGPIEPEALWSRPWNGSWTVVAFDVPEKRSDLRTELRRKLKNLRFGWLQNSVWISPDPAEVLHDSLRAGGTAAGSLSILEGRPAGGETHADLVRAAWDFARLAQEHAIYLKLLEARPARTQHKPAAWQTWLDAEQRGWRKVCRSDPFLPEALLPPGYAGKTVWRARLQAFADASFALAGGAPAATPAGIHQPL